MSHTYRLNLVRDGMTETGIFVRDGIYLETAAQKKFAKRNDRRLQRRSNSRIVAEGLRDWEADISDATDEDINDRWYDDEPMDIDDYPDDFPCLDDMDDININNDPDPSWWYEDNYDRHREPSFSERMAEISAEELVNELQIIVTQIGRADEGSEVTFWTNHKDIVVSELLARMAAAKTDRHRDADTGSHYTFAPASDWRERDLEVIDRLAGKRVPSLGTYTGRFTNHMKQNEDGKPLIDIFRAISDHYRKFGYDK